MTYKIPEATRIGHVHLKVADIQRSLDFYCGLLGFELITMYGKDAAFISAGVTTIILALTPGSVKMAHLHRRTQQDFFTRPFFIHPGKTLQ